MRQGLNRPAGGQGGAHNPARNFRLVTGMLYKDEILEKNAPRVYPFPHKNNSVRTIWTPYPEDTVSRGRLRPGAVGMESMRQDEEGDRVGGQRCARATATGRGRWASDGTIISSGQQIAVQQDACAHDPAHPRERAGGVGARLEHIDALDAPQPLLQMNGGRTVG